MTKMEQVVFIFWAKKSKGIDEIALFNQFKFLLKIKSLGDLTVIVRNTGRKKTPRGVMHSLNLNQRICLGY